MSKCGTYKISGSSYLYIKDKNNLQKVSSWISEQNKVYKNKMPYIDSEKFDSILTQRDKTIREKFDFMMISLSKSVLGDPITLKQINECYIADDKEFTILIEKGNKENFFSSGTTLNFWTNEQGLYWKGFTFEGQEYIETLNAPNQNSKKIFMAFWFDEAKELQNIFDNIIKPAIDNGGFLAERVSSSTTNLENKISDEIIGMIKSSRAVIADCTGNRTAVYYEAGFARGMKIPVIWTCRKKDFGNICFDVSHDPFIVWDDPEDLADKIVKRLKAIL